MDNSHQKSSVMNVSGKSLWNFQEILDLFLFYLSGNSFGRYNRTSEYDCFFKCGQNACGGYSANSIYFAAIGLFYKMNFF